MSVVLKWLGVLGFVGAFTLVSILDYWYVRPNTSYINGDLDMDVWDAAADGTHNSNTDMIFWKGEFYLVYASSPFHWGTEASKLVVRKSSDAEDWEKVIELDFEGEDDIRDPKFANINGTLFLYVLANRGLIAYPYKTVYKKTTNGEDWSDWKELEGIEEGWLFWRPKIDPNHNDTWYVPAYWNEHGKASLFKSKDGAKWKEVSRIYDGDSCDETDIEFYPEGKMISTARLEGSSELGIFGDPSGCTLISVAKYPYEEWEQEKSYITRLDGPNLFYYRGKVYAVGRFEPESKGLFTSLGSFFCKKRTSLFVVEEDKLVYLSDLPSAGDTAYAGVVLKNGYVYISYYTSDVNRDYTWIEGQVNPTNVKMAKIKLSNLEKVADNPPKLPSKDLIKLDSLMLLAGLVCAGYVVFMALKREGVILKKRSK